MSVEAPARTHCPTCGAKLHRQDLSLCAYCATPLGIADGPKTVDPETQKRLQRMREHKLFAAAMEFTPKSPEVEDLAARSKLRATILGGIALACLVWAALIFQTSDWLTVPAGGALFFAIWAIVVALQPAALRKTSEARPMLRRPALVVVRRSEMTEKSGANYYFTLRFDDGSEGEFRWPGQGVHREPLSNGYTGVAYTRGADLVDFRRLT